MEPAKIRGKTLEVRTTYTVYPFIGRLYAMARWEWHRRGDGGQYIGLSCGRQWCAVGPNGFTLSPGWTPKAAASAAEQAVIAVRGWHDEQLLAIPDPAGGPATVSAIRGTIFPAPDLNNLTEASFSTWQTVAYVALSDSHPKYTAMNLVQTPGAVPGSPLDLDRLNVIQMCKGPAATCGAAPEAAYTCKYPDAHPLRWGWARIRRAGTPDAPSSYKYYCVARWDHPYGMSASAPAIVPAARWRWLANDETVWTKCSAGCCEVH